MWLHKCYFLWKPGRTRNSLKEKYLSKLKFSQKIHILQAYFHSLAIWIHGVQSEQNISAILLILCCFARGDLVQNYHLEKSTISVSLSVRTKLSVGVNPCFASEALFSSSDKHRLETDSMLFLQDILFWCLPHLTVTEDHRMGVDISIIILCHLLNPC